MKIKMTLVFALAFIFLCGFKSGGRCKAPVEYTDRGVIVHDPTVTPLYFSGRDRTALMGMAVNEAGNQGIEGMAHVMRVALNRLEYGGYGSDLYSVIYAPNQFAMAGAPTHEFGRECEVAFSWIMHGWDETQGALYFCATGYNGPVPLYTYKGHYSSKT